ncbi:hypothetical protein LOTGIDRAFT_123780, partial [Lottia gigantea]
RFSIDLVESTSEGARSALHFNPRIDEKIVVRNSYDGSWADEERDVPFFPFLEGTKFTLRLLVTDDEFDINMNGKDFIHFHHRMPFNDMYYLALNEDAEYYDVDIQNEKVGYLYLTTNVLPTNLGICQKIPGSLRPGRWIFVHGTAKKDPNKFEINLQCNDTLNYDETDIALHLNPRFSEEVTVRNHLVDGSWGDEEQDQPFFPFEAEDTFNIAINVQSDKFKVYANGRHYIDFDHRIDIGKICHIMLDGDANFFEPEFN